LIAQADLFLIPILLLAEPVVQHQLHYELRQVISGRDVKCLDDIPGGNGNVKVSLQHPENEKAQLILELVLNNGLRE